MLRLGSQSACDLYRFGDRSVGAQLVLPRPPNFSSHDEVGMFELFQSYCDLRIMQVSAVGLPYCIAELQHRQPLYEHHACVLPSDITVGLHRQGLVELGRDGKSYFGDVARSQPVERTALPSE